MTANGPPRLPESFEQKIARWLRLPDENCTWPLITIVAIVIGVVGYVVWKSQGT